MPIHEQEADPVVAAGGSETTQQERTVAADDEREIAVVQDRGQSKPDASHKREQSVRIDDLRLSVAFRRRIRERHVPVVTHVRVVPERFEKSRLSKDRRGTCNAIDPSRRVRRHTEQSDLPHPGGRAKPPCLI